MGSKRQWEQWGCCKARRHGGAGRRRLGLGGSGVEERNKVPELTGVEELGGEVAGGGGGPGMVGRRQGRRPERRRGEKTERNGMN